MSQVMQVVRTTVFAASEGGGNPCPVVLQACELTAAQMQAVARRFGQESGFVVSPAAEVLPQLRFFVPEHEMNMCVHATAACVALLAEAGRLQGGTSSVITGIGQLGTDWSTADAPALATVSVEQLTPVASNRNPSPEEVADVLGVDLADLDLRRGPVQSWSAARPKLVVPLRNADVLDTLVPHWEAMWDLCSAYDTTGVYAFAPHPGSESLAARQFPVRAGYREDAATGVAAAALAGYLVAAAPPAEPGVVRYEIHQGQAMGSPSTLNAVVDWDGAAITRVRIVGDVRRTGVDFVELSDLDA